MGREVLRSMVVLIALMAALPGEAQDRAEAIQAMKRAAAYYSESVASHGGYVYYYSLDLERRWGEGEASPDTIFVQPPGTPRVGMAYLAAYAATQDDFYLDAVRKTSGALVRGQLESGGWTQVIHFSPPAKGGKMGKYRKGSRGSWNQSSLDDGQTQAALEFLARADQALGFRDSALHEAALYGLDALLQAQFPNGAFPQVWAGPVPPHPVKPARYPDYDWRTEGRMKNYWDAYTLNDGLAGTVAQVLLTAQEIYGDAKYRRALEKLGSFLLLAQMPDPQPGWCQQYSYEMCPIWARKFEPPAITAWESQDAMETLIRVARCTGDKKFLEPLPRALAYFKGCVLPDGRVARYYELRSNKPLFMNAGYELTYDDAAAPAHYGWKQEARFAEIEAAYQAALRGEPVRESRATGPLAGQVIEQLDPQGRWISVYAGERLVGQPKFAEGFRYLSSEVFCRNLEVLCRFIASPSR